MMKLATSAFLLSAALLVAGAATQLGAMPAAKAQGDPVAGQKVFQARCAMCHGKTAEGGALAPTLHGAFNAKAASRSFPRYSTALRGSELVWTEANLDSFLQGPKKLVPGTLMYAAIPQATDRHNVIAYISTLKP